VHASAPACASMPLISNVFKRISRYLNARLGMAAWLQTAHGYMRMATYPWLHARLHMAACTWLQTHGYMPDCAWLHMLIEAKCVPQKFRVATQGEGARSSSAGLDSSCLCDTLHTLHTIWCMFVCAHTCACLQDAWTCLY